MIRKLLLLLIAPLALASCNKSLFAPPVQQATPALWVVSDGDTTVYLFGTIHLFTAGTSWLRAGVRDAFDKSGEVRLELADLDETTDRDTTARQKATTNPVPLEQRVPAETMRKLRAALAEYGAPADSMDHYDPWYAASALANMSARKIGYRSIIGIDYALTKDARNRGVPVTGFETAQLQNDYLSSLSPAAQLEMLNRELDGLPTAKKLFDETRDAWTSGDSDKLGRMMNAEFKNAPELVDTMLVKRNARWTDWIVDRMKKPGTVFVAVGAGHLAGDHSLQQMLIKRGYKVYRIRY